jgi:DNA-binding MarR family transcriptional regulator
MEGGDKVQQDKRAGYYLESIRDYNKDCRWFDWDSAQVVLNLVYTYDLVSGYLDDRLLARGLSRSAFNALSIIKRAGPDGCSQRQLSELMLVSRANITEVADCLVRKRLISRRESAKDRRFCLATLTAKGEKLIGELLPFYHKSVRALAAGLTSADKKELNRCLNKLREKTNSLKEE